MGRFDVVYSWGVLHHTGDMARAMRCAAGMVGDGGRFVFALYRRVWMDWFWRIEKRWYAQASPGAQESARAWYGALFKIGLRCTGRTMDDYINGYRGNRGMDFWHDVHDWMGGWPYESISPREVEEMMGALGFQRVLEFSVKGRILGKHSGVFGSGCDEFSYRRVTGPGRKTV
jgi:2-polyprenyl-6-hydroxyphenyl methylase/3-demethylubiquinone-9 3-methyltransferase